ncbi:YcjX family protein [Palleronia caenipelagi]|uniref:YcjX family protein n=2 Tax=Palleronia caenipelagi TaxID=2489174 RepID=A0A547PXV1_9RHOB|nr:YcjX family protein [Palleronia caenipelagi]TRD18975.1 YcjX family protein [Palleronia caenipelagi]
MKDGILTGLGRAGRRLTGGFEPTLRLGVTGLSRAGKTVFITSLVANLLERGRMPGMRSVTDGAIKAVWLQPQPSDTLPRFDYETNLETMTGPAPDWPDSTRAVSELRLSFRVEPGGLLAGVRGPKTLHLDIVDYPGEWLLDLSLLEKEFDDWSADALERASRRSEATAFREALEGADPEAPFDIRQATALAEGWTQYLHAAKAAGYSDCSPGRFLLPGPMEGSPALTFAPLPPGEAPKGSLRAEFRRRYEAYKREIVRPFFRDHFARIDRQIVLVDALGAIHAGPQAVEDLRRAMADVLGAFRPGRNAFLTEILRGKRVEKILFAATKADHLHHTQHGRLTRIMEALVTDAKARADYAGAQTAAIAMASLRATTEDQIEVNGEMANVVRGILRDGRRAAFSPGELPEDPRQLLAQGRQGQEDWLGGDYEVMDILPQPLTLAPGEGPPHIRLDRAAEFLIGDKL